MLSEDGELSSSFPSFHMPSHFICSSTPNQSCPFPCSGSIHKQLDPPNPNSLQACRWTPAKPATAQPHPISRLPHKVIEIKEKLDYLLKIESPTSSMYIQLCSPLSVSYYQGALLLLSPALLYSLTCLINYSHFATRTLSLLLY